MIQKVLTCVNMAARRVIGDRNLDYVITHFAAIIFYCWNTVLDKGLSSLIDNDRFN